MKYVESFMAASLVAMGLFLLGMVAIIAYETMGWYLPWGAASFGLLWYGMHKGMQR